MFLTYDIDRRDGAPIYQSADLAVLYVRTQPIKEVVPTFDHKYSVLIGLRLYRTLLSQHA